MALEPRTVTAEEDNPELRDMTRRFWIAVSLTIPLMAISMGRMLWGHAMVAWTVPSDSIWLHVSWGSILPWLELALATPVVLGVDGRSSSADGPP